MAFLKHIKIICVPRIRSFLVALPHSFSHSFSECRSIPKLFYVFISYNEDDGGSADGAEVVVMMVAAAAAAPNKTEGNEAMCANSHCIHIYMKYMYV